MMATAKPPRWVSSASYERELKAYGRKVNAVFAAHMRDVLLGIQRAKGIAADSDELDDEGLPIDHMADADAAFWEREAARAAAKAAAAVPVPEAAIVAEASRLHLAAVRARRSALLAAGVKRHLLGAQLGIAAGEVVGIDMRLTIAELEKQGQWVSENLQLVKTYPQSQAQSWAGWLSSAIADGQTYRQIQDTLPTHVSGSDYITERIARDQVNKAQAAIGKAFSDEIGSDWYIWRIATNDGRVRESHMEVADRYWRYSDPPEGVGVNGAAENPGRPIQCRCRDEVVIPPHLLGEPPGPEPARGALAR